jgi:hypothetical protein
MIPNIYTRLDQDMSNYEDIPEVCQEQTSKEKSRWWEEEQVTHYHHHGQYYLLHSHE